MYRYKTKILSKLKIKTCWIQKMKFWNELRELHGRKHSVILFWLVLTLLQLNFAVVNYN
jgi:hypothetical protein